MSNLSFFPFLRFEDGGTQAPILTAARPMRRTSEGLPPLALTPFRRLSTKHPGHSDTKASATGSHSNPLSI